MKKIVVLYTKPEDKEHLAEIFSEIVVKGVEIFFCEKKESALEIIEKEHPHLLLLDARFLPLPTSLPTLVLSKEISSQILEKCLPYLDLEHETTQEIPM